MSSSTSKTKKAEGVNEIIDVAIVGGGIAGLYCLYRLLGDRNMETGKREFPNVEKVRLFESCDHLGGRIETWSLKRIPGDIGYASTWDPRHLMGDVEDDHHSPYKDDKPTEYLRAEFGPMRIEPRDQPLLDNLLKKLKINEREPGAQKSLDDLIPFFPYTSIDTESAKFDLKGEEAEEKTPMDLLHLGIRRILEIVDDPLPETFYPSGKGRPPSWITGVIFVPRRLGNIFIVPSHSIADTGNQNS